MAFNLLRKLVGRLHRSTDGWTEVDHRPLVITPPSTWGTTEQHLHDDMVVRDGIRHGVARCVLRMDWDRAQAEAALRTIVNDVLAGRGSVPITADNAEDVLRLARDMRRSDVMALAIPHVKRPKRLLNEAVVLMDDDCVDSLLARMSEDDLNAVAMVHGELIARWEAAIDANRHIPQDRWVDAILPRLHAAGADIMDDRFDDLEEDIHNGRLNPEELEPWLRAVLNFRHRTRENQSGKAGTQPRTPLAA